MEEIKSKINVDITKRILIVVSENICHDGVQVFIKNMLSNMEISHFLIHLYAPGDIESQSMLEDFIEIGVNIILGHWDRECDLRNFVKHNIENLMSQNAYDVVHCNTGKIWMNYYCCVLGMKYGIPVRITHSHNALLPRQNLEVKKQDDSYRKKIHRCATVRLSCSDTAAEWLYGSAYDDYEIMKNGIDLSKYVFSEELRHKARKELGVEGKYVIGHIGAFTEQKNHRYLFDIFREVLNIEKDSILLMIGEGELKEKMEVIANDIKIKRQCVFLGERKDVPYLLTAMDVFVLPSLYEGLSIASIEAQASSLPCVVSERLTKEADILGIMRRLSLETSEEEWAKEILKYKGYKRSDQIKKLKDAGYDVKTSATRLQQLYHGK